MVVLDTTAVLTMDVTVWEVWHTSPAIVDSLQMGLSQEPVSHQKGGVDHHQHALVSFVLN